MTLNLSIPEQINDIKPKITVIGIGGAGGNAVNTMINANVNNIEFITANTDGQALSRSLTPRQIQLGKNITSGLGAGSDFEIGRQAAEESLEEVIAELGDSNMLFITTGMGGGTGSGAAPVIAKAAKEMLRGMSDEQLGIPFTYTCCKLPKWVDRSYSSTILAILGHEFAWYNYDNDNKSSAFINCHIEDTYKHIIEQGAGICSIKRAAFVTHRKMWLNYIINMAELYAPLD